MAKETKSFIGDHMILKKLGLIRIDRTPIFRFRLKSLQEYTKTSLILFFNTSLNGCLDVDGCLEWIWPQSSRTIIGLSTTYPFLLKIGFVSISLIQFLWSYWHSLIFCAVFSSVLSGLLSFGRLTSHCLRSVYLWPLFLRCLGIDG